MSRAGCQGAASLRALACLWALAATLAHAADPLAARAAQAAASIAVAEPEPSDLPSLMRWASHWADRGRDDPAAALARIEQLRKHPPPHTVAPADWQRVLLRTQGLVAARADLGDQAQQVTDELDQASDTEPEATLARADADMVRAARLERAGDPAEFTALTRAVEIWAGVCDDPAVRPRCDPLLRARAHQRLASHHVMLGHANDAVAQSELALALANGSGDDWSMVVALGQLNRLLRAVGDSDGARRNLARILQIGGASRDTQVQAQASLIHGVELVETGDLKGAEAAFERALGFAHAHGPRWLEARVGVHLADLALRLGDAARALERADESLRLLPPWAELPLRQAARMNRALARLRLGQTAPARAEIETVLAEFGAAQSRGRQSSAMAEYADALAATGDVASAVLWFHREQALRVQMAADERRAALDAAQARYDRRAQEQALARLAQQNDITAAQVQSQTLRQRLWLALAIFALAAAVAAALALRRVRAVTQMLVRSRARLQAQSERDALTGLVNRRHLERRLVQADAAGSGFAGTLLLVDVDHFKRINDAHGHAAGDAALKAVAARLASAVRDGDAVGRWGGEEFLVCAAAAAGGGEQAAGAAMAAQAFSAASAAGALKAAGGAAADVAEAVGAEAANGAHAANATDAAEALARRLALAVAAEPIDLDTGTALAVRVSVGWARFPLPGQQVPLGWAAALRLVDLALYAAKAAGRDRCVGVVAARIDAAQDVGALEADWAAAVADGRVRLRVAGGEETP